jgi:DNA end-binding protein Ku
MARERGEEEEEGSPRGALWSGTLSFGLVSIPVELYPAVHPGRTPLRLLDAEGAPLQRHFYCPQDEREVPLEELVRGFELPDGRFVQVTDEELQRLEPKKTREIDLRRFVRRDGLDPIRFERAYLLVPAGGGEKAYRLLATAMEESQRAGIATFVMRDREYLVAIFSDRGVLCAETLRFDDELRQPPELARSEAAPAAVHRCEQAIAKLAKRELDPDELADRGAPAVRELAERKQARGEAIAHGGAEPQADEGGQIIDLVAELKRKLEASRERAPAARKHTRRKRRS